MKKKKKQMLLLLIGLLSIGVATCHDENQILRQKKAVVLVSNIEAPLWLLCGSVMVAAWCLCVCGFGIPVLCQFGFIFQCCCTSGSLL